MLGTQQQADGIPDFVRVKAQRGFRGIADGRFQEVKVGEVVEVSKALAVELRMSGKAHMTQEPLGKVKKEKEKDGGKEAAGAGAGK